MSDNVWARRKAGSYELTDGAGDLLARAYVTPHPEHAIQVLATNEGMGCLDGIHEALGEFEELKQATGFRAKHSSLI